MKPIVLRSYCSKELCADPEKHAEWLASYLEQQREYYAVIAGPLSDHHKALLWPYFSPQLLDEIRLVEWRGARIDSPELLLQFLAQGYSPPEIGHLESVTFVDVVVFSQEFAERRLFQALVHAAQIRILGLQSYTQLWVQSFLKTRSHFSVPLEVHAFSLAAKFPSQKFCVEDHVLRWVIDNRY